MLYVPIGLGFIVNKLFYKFTSNVKKVLPLISVTAIVMIVAAVVSANSAKILTTGLVVFAVVILHNCGGYALGYTIAKMLGLNFKSKKNYSYRSWNAKLQVLTSSLATTAFPNLAMATVPGAIFSVWHNISGAIIASIFLR